MLFVVEILSVVQGINLVPLENPCFRSPSVGEEHGSLHIDSRLLKLGEEEVEAVETLLINDRGLGACRLVRHFS